MVGVPSAPKHSRALYVNFSRARSRSPPRSLFYGGSEIHHRHTREALVVRVSVLPARIAVQHVNEGTAVSMKVSTALIGRACARDGSVIGISSLRGRAFWFSIGIRLDCNPPVHKCRPAWVASGKRHTRTYAPAHRRRTLDTQRRLSRTPVKRATRGLLWTQNGVGSFLAFVRFSSFQIRRGNSRV